MFTLRSDDVGSERPVRAYVSSALFLLVLTALSILVHGYHFGAEDQDVYVSAITKAISPGLFPHNSEFFTVQMRGMGTHFDQLFAFLVRHSGLSVAFWVLLGHVLSLFLIYFGLWQIAGVCMSPGASRRGAMLMVAGLLTLPVAGTRLFIVDQYLHPRALATAGLVLAIAAALKQRWPLTVACLFIAFLMHPLMAAFGASFLVFLCIKMPDWATLARRCQSQFAMFSLPFLAPVTLAWRQAAEERSFYFLWRWEWYELLGAIAPFLFLWWFNDLAKRRELSALSHLCSRLMAFGLFQFAVALTLTLPSRLIRLACYEPMRWLHLFYLLFVFIAGGLIGEYLVRDRQWRLLVLFVPLMAGMFYVQRQLFPQSSHFEFGLNDGSNSRNEWVRAYAWIRQNTPADAYFAMSPNYLKEDGQDFHGFRVLAERSMLAENGKDPGAAVVFPELLPQWKEQVNARKNWKDIDRSDLQKLKGEFGTDWAVVTEDVKHPLLPDLAHSCRYRSQHVCVLQIS